MSAKKLLNATDECVDEALWALGATNPNVGLVENRRVVVRSDVQALKGKVAILCGGGSGNKYRISPAHS